MIDCLMKASSGMWSAFASAATRVSRSGPTVPDAPAGLKVWQLPQPFETKTAFPAAALPAALAAAVVVAGAVVAAAVVVCAAAVVAAADVVTVTVRVPPGFPSE